MHYVIHKIEDDGSMVGEIKAYITILKQAEINFCLYKQKFVNEIKTRRYKFSSYIGTVLNYIYLISHI